MKRGELWTASGGRGYAGKPRPVVIVQDDRFAATASITVCPLTSDPTRAPLIRLEVKPSPSNGLRAASSLMIDKLSTIPRVNLGNRVGQLSHPDLIRMERAILVFLGLAG